LVTGFGYVSSRHAVLLEVQDHLIHEVEDKTSLLQRNALQNLTLGRPDEMRQAIMWLASEPDVNAIVVIDSQGVVAATDQDHEHGMSWRDLPYDIDVAIVEQIKQFGGVEIVAGQGPWVTGYASICDPQGIVASKPGVCGFVLYQIDGSTRRAEATDALTGQAIFTGTGIAAIGLFLWIFLHFAVARRITGLLQTVNAFSHGDRTARTGLRGGNELARIGAAMDTMFDRVASDETSLSEDGLLKQAIIDSANYMIVSTYPDGTFRTFNAVAERLLGYRADEVIGKVTPAIIHDPAEIVARADALSKELNRRVEPGLDVFTVKARRGEVDENEWTCIRKDGSRFPLSLSMTALRDADGQITGFLGVAYDITEQKQAELLNRRFGKILESSLNEIYIFDGATFRFIEVNRGARRNLGYSMAELRELSPWSLKPEMQEQAFHDLIEPLCTGEKEIIRFETAHQRKDGSRYPVEVHLQRFAEDAGSVFIGVALDITERKRDHERLMLAEKVFHNAGNGILVSAPDSTIVDVNRAYEEITGFRREDVIGRKPNMTKSGRHGEGFLLEMWQTLKEKGEWSSEYWDRRKSGEVYPCWVTINAITDEDGELVNYVAVFKDVTEQKTAEAKLEQLAYFDSLTTLPNRSLFRDRLEHHIDLSARRLEKFALLFIDLDRFKNVNDTLGHDIGDALLEQVSIRLQTCVRRSDTLARLGGDEFTVILSEMDRRRDATICAETILEHLGRPIEIDDHEVFVGASIGIAIYPDDGTDFAALTKNADTAMYRAKDNGRGRYQFFNAEMNQANERRATLEKNLRRAVEYEEFELHYQPVVDIRDDRVVGFEALLRWSDPDLGPVSPAEFVPIAEEVRLIAPIGEWVLRTACAQIKAWRNAGHGLLSVSINLSAEQFQMSDLVALVGANLEAADLPPHVLTLEITETAVMADAGRTQAILGQLRSLGVRVSVDDFGTGYSSLGYLKKYPIQTVKIDRSFVDGVDNDPDDAAIVESIITLAENLNLEVIAEGVETAAQRDFLKNQNCFFVQGYFYGKPLPAELAIEQATRSSGALESEPIVDA
jgi:diguanylate cyclase (GGDEF)-like protein/PAS domain S-box-containing protein